MRAAGAGRIVLLASQAALVSLPEPGRLHGLEGRGRRADPQPRDRLGAARHHGQRDLPDLRVDADGRADARDRGGAPAAVRRIPLGRVGQPRDIAGVAAFLCSPAAALVTGVRAAGRRRLDRGRAGAAALGRPPRAHDQRSGRALEMRIETAFALVYSSSVSAHISRPKPLALTPPSGCPATTSNHVLTQTVPASSCRAMRCARPRSRRPDARGEPVLRAVRALDHVLLVAPASAR